MSIAAGASAWLTAPFLLLLAIAAIEDGWRLRISNLIVLGVAATGIAAIAYSGIGWGAWQPLLLSLAILFLGAPLFAIGWLGGGDVKLLAANGLWFTFDGGWKMLAAVAVAGGLVTILAMIVRGFRHSGPGRDGVAKSPRFVIPYGIGISVGAAATIILARVNLW